MLNTSVVKNGCRNKKISLKSHSLIDRHCITKEIIFSTVFREMVILKVFSGLPLGAEKTEAKKENKTTSV